ncbi:MOSC domain-containing protein [Oerskovia sp. Sa1BUA8]|uniref:MOSC domain-containing protein n=1 Tax=Oerskovia douganii TaxID=2762210 RepID=A0A9D5UC56_9CELL|nr:MOSC domain-containing protein [Oerskovia douganii]MBE7701624.1 MOSC domain-containing protein [Oerskovia douganii]
MTPALPAPARPGATGELLAVCRVHVLLPDAGTVGVTAIDKRPVEGPVKVRPLGLYADVQADRAHHGGEEQAVYAYSQEDADHWSAELGYEVVPGLFGENFRTRGVAASGALIGERWQVGSAVLEVTQPRTPCATFARRLGEDRWVKRFTDANRTGAYLRVVTPGEVQAGDTVEVVRSPSHGVSIADWFGSRAAGTAADLAARLLASQEAGEVRLSAEMLERAERAVR